MKYAFARGAATIRRFGWLCQSYQFRSESPLMADAQIDVRTYLYTATAIPRATVAVTSVSRTVPAMA